MRSDEKTLLQPWFDAFTRAHGVSPQLKRLRCGVLPPFPDLWGLVFPKVFDETEHEGDILGRVTFDPPRPIGDQIRSFGYNWDEGGCLVQSPTPYTLNDMFRLLGFEQTGFRVEYYVADREAKSLFLLRLLDGVWAVPVAPKAFYDEFLPPGRRTPKFLRRYFRSQTAALAHDMINHLMNLVFVPWVCLHEISMRIRTALPEVVRDLRTPAGTGPLTLTFFYDNDLNRYAQQIWHHAETATRFQQLFAASANFSQLLDVLETRIRQTREGLYRVKVSSSEEAHRLLQNPPYTIHY